ncbi:PucR family transcriptional regulator [Nocardia sp. NPDC056611]|uniref:PucR family transcriptional regulator n=1 Tax=Nocardia sp. NPDC056611 TaxID=3345877 RepID=UPI003670DFDC
MHIHWVKEGWLAMDMDRPEIPLQPDRRRVAAQIATLISEVDPELRQISAELTNLYRDNIPVYDQVDPDSIEQNTHVVLQIAVRHLRSDLAQSGFDELATLARVWADQQIPLELVAHSIQIGARRIFAIIRERAISRAIPAHTIDAMQDLMWEWATASATAVHMVLQDHAIAGATRRADFLHRLVDGSLSPGALAIEAENYRLDPDHLYRIAYASWSETNTASELLAYLRARGSTSKLPVVDTVIDGHLVALLPRTPEDKPQMGTVALGSSKPLAEASLSYRHAREALELANRHGRIGLVDLATLGPLPLLGYPADAVDMLVERHLTPLLRQGASGEEVATTVEAFLACDRRIDDTAAKLFIHRNTVRNRLIRFAEITGLNLDYTDDLIVTWWLLNHHRNSSGATN